MHLDADGVSRKVFRLDDVKSTAVFPVFWKFSDWGADLGQLTLDATDNYKKYECHLCDPRFLPAYQQCSDASPADGSSKQLALPNPPGNYNGGNCVFDPRHPRDKDKKIIRPDMVKTIEDLIVFPESHYATDCGETVGKWKRGTDHYCSTRWPYSIGCEKSGGYNCTDRDGNPGFPCVFPCGHAQAGNPAMWPDDPFDDFMFVSKAFAIWAQNLADTDDQRMQRDFNSWYPEFLSLLSPSGEVMQWRNEMQGWSDKINNWLNTASFRGSDCDEALCLPPASSTGISNTWPTREVGTPNGQCPGLKQSEAATFGGGHLNDVLACLDYNLANLSKFSTCADADSCTEANCSNLPRSLLVNDLAGTGGVDYFDTNDFVVPRDPDVTAFANCLTSCSTSNCAKPPLPVSPTPWQGPTKGPVIPKYAVDSQTFVPPDTVLQGQLLACKAPTNPLGCPACQALCDGAKNICSGNRDNCNNGCDTTYNSCVTACGTPAPAACLKNCSDDQINCKTECNTSFPCEVQWTACYNLCFCSVPGIGTYNCPNDVYKNCNLPPPFHPSCAADYNACIATCLGDPFDSGAQSCFAGCSSAYNGCISGCSSFQAALDAAGGTCGPPAWNFGNPYYLAVANSWKEAKGSCLDKVGGFPQQASDGFFYSHWQSKFRTAADEAQNQLVKLQKRKDFLAARATEIRNMKGFFDLEIAQMDTLLEAAKKVIDAKITNQKQHSLPGFAIYGWKGEPAPGATRGQWHIVRVDAREPGRCNGNCGKPGSPPGDNGKPVEPDLPTIKTYTLPAPPWVKGLIFPIGFLSGWTRCFSLGDVFDKSDDCNEKSDYSKARHCFKGGVVKAQVIRWDENQQQLTFPGKFNLWKFIFNHPLAPGGVPSANDLDTICPSLPEAPGAFMLNRPPDDSEDHRCWDKVNRLLEHGVSSRACAEYYYHSQTPKGFNLKFANCPPGEF